MQYVRTQTARRKTQTEMLKDIPVPSMHSVVFLFTLNAGDAVKSTMCVDTVSA